MTICIQLHGAESVINQKTVPTLLYLSVDAIAHHLQKNPSFVDNIKESLSDDTSELVKSQLIELQGLHAIIKKVAIPSFCLPSGKTIKKASEKELLIIDKSSVHMVHMDSLQKKTWSLPIFSQDVCMIDNNLIISFLLDSVITTINTKTDETHRRLLSLMPCHLESIDDTVIALGIQPVLHTYNDRMQCMSVVYFNIYCPTIRNIYKTATGPVVVIHGGKMSLDKTTFFTLIKPHGTENRIQLDDNIIDVTITPQGDFIVALSHAIKHITWGTKQETLILSVMPEASPVVKIEVLADNTLLVAFQDGTMRHVDMPSRTRLGILTEHKRPVSVIAHTNNLIATASDDIICLWNYQRECLQKLAPNTPIQHLVLTDSFLALHARNNTVEVCDLNPRHYSWDTLARALVGDQSAACSPDAPMHQSKDTCSQTIDIGEVIPNDAIELTDDIKSLVRKESGKKGKTSLCCILL